MHPQLIFRDNTHQHHWNHKVAANDKDSGGGRIKRDMPPITFNAPDLEKDGDFWQNSAQDKLKIQLQKNMLNKNIARNIIMFLGDGMSLPTITATRVYMGGEEKELSFEKFPYSGLSKVR